MKKIYPFSSWTPEFAESLGSENRDALVDAMRNLIDGSHPGLLATVDEHGCPRTRWMATMSFEKFPHIHTLTAPGSRKLAHIARTPFVNWTFSNQDLSLVLSLSGTARVLTNIIEIKRIWRMIGDKSQAYFLNTFCEKPGFAVMETTVTEVECCVPKYGFRWSVSADFLKPHP